MSVPGKVAVLLVGFGEPPDPTEESVRAYLERIFLRNVALDPAGGREGEARVRELASRRAPGLLEAYRAIGGSPLNAQADDQAERVARELTARGWDVRVYSAFQFTEPFVRDAVSLAKVAGAETVVGLPVYPLCGRSTTVAALDDAQRSLDELEWRPRFVPIAGWHHHAGYRALRADGVRAFARARGLDLSEPDTLLFFSVHGTPLAYLGEDARYDRYVEEHCRDVAVELGVSRYVVGFQNHENRPIPWTRPAAEDALREAPERRVVAVPVSFMHEQSETLVELDRDLKGLVEGLGKELHRVPVPHDEPRFPAILAELVAEAVAGGLGPSALGGCRCRPAGGTVCTNGGRDLPPSPYKGRLSDVPGAG